MHVKFKYFFIGFIFAIIGLGIGYFATSSNNTIESERHLPKEGYIRKSSTAVKIAEAILLDLYGKKIYGEEPFKAKLKGDVWSVKGTLPKGSVGGVAEIYISKKDGEILKVMHGK